MAGICKGRKSALNSTCVPLQLPNLQRRIINPKNMIPRSILLDVQYILYQASVRVSYNEQHPKRDDGFNSPRGWELKQAIPCVSTAGEFSDGRYEN